MKIISTTTDKAPNDDEIVLFEQIHLNEIPLIMKNMKWNTASSLMQYWFDGKPAYKIDDPKRKEYMEMESELIPKEYVNENIVKMSWALEFKIIKDAISTLKLIWNSDNGKNRLFGEIFEKNFQKGNLCIGNSDDVIYLDTYAQVNFLPFGNSSENTNVDELRGAIGAGILKVCVKGNFDIMGDKKKFITDKIGFYIKDTYNFSGKELVGKSMEPLGVWSRNGVLNFEETTAFMASHINNDFMTVYQRWRNYIPVFNEDFRMWQDKHNEGRDFIVFSDVYWDDPLEKDKIILEN